MRIRRALDSDFEAMWPIFQAVVADGSTYCFSPNTDHATAFDYWFHQNDPTTYVAEKNGAVVGFYRIVAYQRDQGSHIANAAFMVDPALVGRGIGKTIGMHCMKESKRAGYKALLFFCVVSTNERAVALWKKLRFIIVGTVPLAFMHPQKGLVDVFVMHRFLDDIDA